MTALDWSAIGRRLAAGRAGRKLAEAAREAGLTYQQLWNLENGFSRDRAALAKACRHFRVDLRPRPAPLAMPGLRIVPARRP